MKKITLALALTTAPLSFNNLKAEDDSSMTAKAAFGVAATTALVQAAPSIKKGSEWALKTARDFVNSEPSSKKTAVFVATGAVAGMVLYHGASPVKEVALLAFEVTRKKTEQALKATGKFVSKTVRETFTEKIKGKNRDLKPFYAALLGSTATVVLGFLAKKLK